MHLLSTLILPRAGFPVSSTFVPSSPASTYVVHLSSAYTGGTRSSSSSLSTDLQERGKESVGTIQTYNDDDDEHDVLFCSVTLMSHCTYRATSRLISPVRWCTIVTTVRKCTCWQ